MFPSFLPNAGVVGWVIANLVTRVAILGALPLVLGLYGPCESAQIAWSIVALVRAHQGRFLTCPWSADCALAATTGPRRRPVVIPTAGRTSRRRASEPHAGARDRVPGWRARGPGPAGAGHPASPLSVTVAGAGRATQARRGDGAPGAARSAGGASRRRNPGGPGPCDLPGPWIAWSPRSPSPCGPVCPLRQN